MGLQSSISQVSPAFATIRTMTRPQPTEAAPYYSRYTDLVPEDEIVPALRSQLEETMTFLATISEEQSKQSYQAGKWTIRQVLNHVNDGERIFAYRALWIARGFKEPLPGFEQDDGVEAAKANEVPWKSLVEEFRSVRLATLSLFENVPSNAWSNGGVASDNPVTVRALAYIIAGHVRHHVGVLKERYLA
jgi:hypothetical protein